MTNNQLTKGELRVIADTDHVQCGDAAAMAKMLLEVMDSKPIGITDRIEIEGLKRGRMANVMPPDYKGVDAGDEVFVYAVPQSAQVVAKDHQIRELVNMLRDIAIKYHGTQQLREHIAWVVRAAMLQAGDFRESRNSSTNNFREIPETSTSDHWVSISERVPDKGEPVLLSSHLDVSYKIYCRYGEFWYDWFENSGPFSLSEFTHWCPLPAPPQEVKHG